MALAPNRDAARRALHADKRTDVEIAAAEGVKVGAIIQWRTRRGLQVNSPAAVQKWEMTPERSDERMALYKKGLTDAEIARRQGVTDDAVRGWRIRRGLPAKNAPSTGQRTSNKARKLEAFLLMDQDISVREIRRRVGVGRRTAEEWRTEYLRAHPKRVAAVSKAEKRRSIRDNPNAIYAGIRRALGRTIAADLLDDAASEMWLAVAEGKLALADISKAATTFRNRAVADYANRFGPRSLDEEIGAEGDGFRMIDLIPDDRSMSWLEEMGATVS